MRSCPAAHAGTWPCLLGDAPWPLPVSRCFKGCWIPLPQILGSSSSRRMAKGQSGLVPKDPSIGLPWIDSIRARPLPGGLWVTNRFSRKAGSYSLPSIKKRLFMIDYVMNEPPPDRLIWTVDTDTFVINGNTLLLEKFDCAPLMGRNQFLQSRGEVKHVPPTVVQAAVPVMSFCERKIVQKVHVNQLPLAVEGDDHVKNPVIYILKMHLKSNKLRNIDHPILIQLDWFPQLVGRPGRQVRHVCRHSCQECPRRCTLTVEPKLPECSKGELKVINRYPFLVVPDCLTADCGNTHFEKDKDREVWQSTEPGTS